MGLGTKPPPQLGKMIWPKDALYTGHAECAFMGRCGPQEGVWRQDFVARFTGGSEFEPVQFNPITCIQLPGTRPLRHQGIAILFH